MKLRSCLGKLVLVTVSVSLTLFVCELIFRWFVFSGPEGLDKFRQPGNYASIMSDDYWKLAHYWGRDGAHPPEHPHPYLGWTHDFDIRTYLHKDFAELGRRRPVLLYGDSFAMCVPQSHCFQDLLNADSTFARDHYLLNYGVGGYGLGQISLLYSLTAHRYRRPFVVFSMLTADLDRTILSVRTGQKPYFEVENDSLKLKGLPIYPNPEEWFDAHPVSINSYLWRRFVYSNLNILPSFLDPRASQASELQGRIRSTNRKLLEQVTTDLRERDFDFVFLVFHYKNNMMEVDEWHDVFLKNVLDSLQVPYIWSKDLIRADMGEDEFDYDKYIIPGEGHPTTYYNQLVSDAIQRAVFAADSVPYDSLLAPYSYEAMVTFWENKIMENAEWKAKIEAKAVESGLPFEVMRRRDAVWMVNDKAKAENTWLHDEPSLSPSFRFPVLIK